MFTLFVLDINHAIFGTAFSMLRMI